MAIARFNIPLCGGGVFFYGLLGGAHGADLILLHLSRLGSLVQDSHRLIQIMPKGLETCNALINTEVPGVRQIVNQGVAVVGKSGNWEVLSL